MKFLVKYKQQIKFYALLNLIVAAFITFASYIHLPLKGFSDYSFYIAHFLVLQFTVFGFLYLLSLQKHLFRIVFPILFIIASTFSYWVYTLDVSITKSLIQAVVETQWNIAVDLISLPFIFYLLLIGFAVFFILNQYKKIENSVRKTPFIILSIIAIFTFYYTESKRFKTLKRRLPYNLFYGIKDYYSQNKLVLQPVSSTITSLENNLNIVFILGESLRADHLSINGYSRNTTPNLAKEKNIISFNRVFTPLTYTAVSIPQILTNLSIHDTIKKEAISLYAVLNQASFSTYWIGNQSMEKSFEPIVKTNKNIVLIDKYHSVLSYHKKLDNQLIAPFEKRFESEKNQFFTLHMIGSHWYYENRYSKEFQKFTPTIQSKHIPSSTKKELINSYDNTILFFDNFMNQIIQIAKKSSKPTLIIYLADHGEILGENGKWLHAQEDDASQNPAMVVWYSDEFKNTYPEYITNLQLNANKKITTDFLYHSILDVLKIENFNYDTSKSIFKKEVKF